MSLKENHRRALLSKFTKETLRLEELTYELVCNIRTLESYARREREKMYRKKSLNQLKTCQNYAEPSIFHLFFLSLFQQDPESCADLGLFASLPPMPNFALFPRESSSSTAFPSELLHAMYTSFHSLSAHFHFMRADWRRGRSCSARGAHSDIVFGVERYVWLGRLSSVLK